MRHKETGSLSEIALFIRGILIGFAIAAPVGPIGVLCIRRTLVEGRIAGLISGLGAASADALYGIIAALGFTLLADFLTAQQVWLRLLGGFFLCYLGVRAFLAPPVALDFSSPGKKGLLSAYITTFFLTLTNPLTIFAFAAIYAGVTSAGLHSANAFVLVLGVFSGSALWWTVLSAGVSLFRNRVTPTALVWINRISGAFIVGFGFKLLLGR